MEQCEQPMSITHNAKHSTRPRCIEYTQRRRRFLSSAPPLDDAEFGGLTGYSLVLVHIMYIGTGKLWWIKHFDGQSGG